MANTFKVDTKSSCVTDAHTNSSANVLTAGGSATLILLSILVANKTGASADVDVFLVTNTGDANTGLISPAADEIALVTGGSSRLTIDANGAATFTGNVQVNGTLSVTGSFDSGENLALIIALG